MARSRVSSSANDAERPRSSSLVPLKVGLPKLWKAMILTSFLLNLLLLLVVGLLLGFVMQYRNQVQQVAGTGQSFARTNVAELQDVVSNLQTAHIRTTIQIDERLPVEINVPINQTTLVTTTVDTPINVPASIDLGQFGQLYPNVNLNLPAGTPLLIQLKLDVPLATSIPVQLDVPVDIALAETELGPEFQRLGALVDRLVALAEPLLGEEQ